MSTERDVTPIVRSWLEAGPTALPDRVLDDVLDRIPSTSQHRPPWSTRRPSLMSHPVRMTAVAAAIGLLAVVAINVLPRGGDGIGTDVPSPSLAPSPVTSPATTLSLEPPANVDAYVTSAYDDIVDLPALSVTVVESEGTKARFMYDGAGLVHQDHYSSSSASSPEPSESRILSRDTIAQRSDLNGEPIWLERSGQGHPLRELAGATGLSSFCETTWAYVGLEYLLDRPTHRVACGLHEMWLDVETRLPLRSVFGEAEGPARRLEVLELTVGPQPKDLFVPPAGLRVMTDREFECASDSACRSPAPEPVRRPVITPAPMSPTTDLAVPPDLDAFVADVLGSYAVPRALTMAVDEGDGVTWFTLDGSGRSRIDNGSEPSATTVAGQLVTGGHEYGSISLEDGSLVWVDQGANPGTHIPDLGLSIGCREGWAHRGFDLVLDRPAHHLVCGYWEFWIDHEWRLVTRQQRNPGPLEYDTEVAQVTDVRMGQPSAELFELPADAVVYDAACFQRDRVICGPRSSDGEVVGGGPSLIWSKVGPEAVSNIAWLGDRFVLVTADGAVSTSPDGVTWEPIDARDPDAGYGEVLADSDATATWGDTLVGWTPSAIRAARPGSGMLIKDDFAGKVGSVGVGPAGIVARVHSGVDFDAFVTGLIGPDWIGQIKEFEYDPVDGVLHIGLEDGRSEDIVMADHGLGSGDVADRGYGWFSADGATWSLIPDFPSNVSEIIGVEDGFIAIGETTLHSPDGQTWTDIGEYVEGPMRSWRGGALVIDPSGGANLWTRSGPTPLPIPGPPGGDTGSGVLPGSVGVGPLGMVSVGAASVLFSPDGSAWSMRPLPEEMYASRGGRRPTRIVVSDGAVLVLMWSGGAQPVPTLWRGTIES